ncbi:glycosyltransferase family 2 protein [Mycoplasmoides alvi]|uniref:glycosyltransferase family 2 protein n=1 Tax=Mycoplasmoides alvi TaxID=78580 RepID=UPI00051C6B34
MAAKNEAVVIKDVIHSLLNQVYNKELFHIYVVADNCTDDTAKIANEISKKFNGRITVLERFNDKYKGANFAIQHALKHIQESKIEYDAYCYFDSDNIVDKNWLKKVVSKLKTGCEVITTFRNSINCKDNWISASYAIQFIKESTYMNYSREKLNMTSWINGTGFCFTNRILKLTNYWDFNSLSHDIEFTQFLSLNNVKCGYVDDAVFYDEQPIKFKDSYKQRLRWCKGFLQVFRIYGKSEFKDLCKINSNKNKKSIYANFALIFPQIVFFLLNLFNYLLLSIILIFVSESEKMDLFFKIQQYWIFTPIAIVFGFYLNFFLIGLIVIIQQYKQIDCKFIKLFGYIFMYPFFMFSYVPISLISIFKKNISVSPTKRKPRN